MTEERKKKKDELDWFFQRLEVRRYERQYGVGHRTGRARHREGRTLDPYFYETSYGSRRVRSTVEAPELLFPDWVHVEFEEEEEARKFKAELNNVEKRYTVIERHPKTHQWHVYSLIPDKTQILEMLDQLHLFRRKIGLTEVDWGEEHFEQNGKAFETTIEEHKQIEKETGKPWWEVSIEEEEKKRKKQNGR